MGNMGSPFSSVNTQLTHRSGGSDPRWQRSRKYSRSPLPATSHSYNSRPGSPGVLTTPGNHGTGEIKLWFASKHYGFIQIDGDIPGQDHDGFFNEGHVINRMTMPIKRFARVQFIYQRIPKGVQCR